MTAEEVEKRARLGEDSVTEFKGLVQNSYQIDAKDIAKSITALANSRGGHLFLGVEDDGDITGAGDVTQVDALMRQVSQACEHNIQPATICDIEKIEVRAVIVLVVTVRPFSPDRPYHVGGKYYIRDVNRSREARREELIRLLQSANYHYDEQPVEGATLDDLETEVARSFLSEIYQEPDLEARWVRLLTELHCVDHGGVPTVTGMLLFGRKPQNWIPDARISAVLFQGREMQWDFADRQEIEGRLLDQIDAAVGFLKRTARAPSRVVGIERKEEGIPEEVFREAVLNAVSHRDYRAPSQVRIFVFDDRVELVNPGELLNQLTIDGICIGGISQRRNPALAGLLARARRRENIGMGVPALIAALKARGLPRPEITAGDGHFKLVIRWSGETGE
ncbi:MAG TPA: RNA-binding domain-containing protein [Myxococcaceae bacterium]|nr:RNA-binding domain-containing protein [Myxococcaceae bacterium]